MIINKFEIRVVMINAMLKFIKHSKKYFCIHSALKIKSSTNTSFSKNIKQITPITNLDLSFLQVSKSIILFSSIPYSTTRWAMKKKTYSVSSLLSTNDTNTTERAYFQAQIRLYHNFHCN